VSKDGRMDMSPEGFAGAFVTVFCIFIPLILLTLEAFWFWYWFSYGDITHQRLYIIEMVTGTLVFLTIVGVIKGIFFVGFLAIPIPMVLWFLMKQQEDKTDKLNKAIQERAEIKRLLEVINRAEEPALLYKALVELGDLYFKKTEFDKAMGCYRQADEISKLNQTKGLVGLSFKIKVTEKENRIKKGEIWICSECGLENPGNISVCKKCGNTRDLEKSVKRDVILHKKEIKTDALNIIFPVVMIVAGLHLLYLLLLLLVFLYRHMPFWAAVPLIIVISTVSVFFFLKLFAFLKNTVIPKLLR
jgi:tetratricopeptide (TPR) repeat protein